MTIYNEYGVPSPRAQSHLRPVQQQIHEMFGRASAEGLDLQQMAFELILGITNDVTELKLLQAAQLRRERRS